jgi:hypothetical protein
LAESAYDDSEIDELVSHVMALRMDFIQDLLRAERISFTGLRKGELRERLRGALADGRLTVEQIVSFLDGVEPGGKQHVFLLRPSPAVNDAWRDADRARARLHRRRQVKAILDATLPLLMPDELTLSRILIAERAVEITGVEARTYFERDEALDQQTVTDDGLPVELRAHVRHVARSRVTLRWNTATRHAALHITQATGRGLERDHYRKVLERFAAAVAPWLDLSTFHGVDLHRVIHQLHDRERRRSNALTVSRRGRWEMLDGSEMEAVSASMGASLFHDARLTAAIDQVADSASGQSGNLYWLARRGTPLSEDLHVTIVASDSRVHFMRPSARESVEHVIEQIRTLL